MKICAAQTRPARGKVISNIENHKRLISLAVSNDADAIIFPELSITGYEPELAKELATDANDNRFDVFQEISERERIIIGIGVPTKNAAGICISTIVFQPQKPRQTYSKKYLHADEEPFFISGRNSADLINDTEIALAICYELSIPEHSENAFKSRATIYAASVVKTTAGVEKACHSLSAIAKKYSMTVLMANSVGMSGDGECAGKTSVWNDEGALVGQLNDADEGIIIIDTNTRETIEKTMRN